MPDPKPPAPNSSDAAREAAEQIGDPDFAAKLEGLPPEQIQAFVEMLRVAARKQRVMALGYLAALIGLLGGLAIAFVMFANAERGTFIGWVFLLPFTIAATVLWIVGRITKRMSVRVVRDPEAEALVEKVRSGGLEPPGSD